MEKKSRFWKLKECMGKQNIKKLLVYVFLCILVFAGLIFIFCI